MSAEGFKSIALFLPLQSSTAVLRWSPQVEYALKAVTRGPRTSQVTSALAFCDFVEDLRESSDLRPLHRQVSRGLSLFFDEFEPAEEFFESTLPNIAALALELPSLLEHHEAETKRLSAAMSAPTQLRILIPQEGGIVILHQQLIAALLACSFLCLYPERAALRKIGLVSINFDGLYMCVSRSRKSSSEKLRCILNYFRRVGTSMPNGSVSFERRILPLKHTERTEPLLIPTNDFWSDSKKQLCYFKVENDGRIEDAGPDYLQVDFANEQLGGGALHLGCVQEEIRFMLSPECIVGMLFLPTMSDNESIEIVGAETYSQYSGYGQTFSFAGNHEDSTRRDSLGRRQTHLIAIDALCLPGESQFEDGLMIRELNKAFCGFLCHSTICGFNETSELESFTKRNFGSGNAGVGGICLASEDSQHSQFSEFSYEGNYEISLDSESGDSLLSYPSKDEVSGSNRATRDQKSTTCIIHEKLLGVATGNWGSGAFGGDLQLKSLLQWLAASQAGCPSMIYCSFGDKRAQRLQEVIDWIQKEEWSVSELWSMVKLYGKFRLNRQVNSELFEWILPQRIS